MLMKVLGHGSAFLVGFYGTTRSITLVLVAAAYLSLLAWALWHTFCDYCLRVVHWHCKLALGKSNGHL